MKSEYLEFEQLKERYNAEHKLHLEQFNDVKSKIYSDKITDKLLGHRVFAADSTLIWYERLAQLIFSESHDISTLKIFYKILNSDYDTDAFGNFFLNTVLNDFNSEADSISIIYIMHEQERNLIDNLENDYNLLVSEKEKTKC